MVGARDEGEGKQKSCARSLLRAVPPYLPPPAAYGQKSIIELSRLEESERAVTFSLSGYCSARLFRSRGPTQRDDTQQQMANAGPNNADCLLMMAVPCSQYETAARQSNDKAYL